MNFDDITVDNRKDLIKKIANMNWRTFITYSANTFEHNGYQTLKVVDRNNYGADFILEKDGTRIAVQARHSQKKNIRFNLCIEQIVTARIFFKCDEAMIVTNTGFPKVIPVLAEVNKCIFMDGDEFIKLAEVYEIFLAEKSQYNVSKRLLRKYKKSLT